MDVNATVASGRLKRFVEFDFRKPDDVRRYNFSKSINFSKFIKEMLDEEMDRRQSSNVVGKDMRLGE